ncbi:MAG: calcium-binding protein, partial [Alphaproteobacteria bacterium]|nr:calcium-binding protein [Alphaproteobacteria bacterium]
TPGNSNIIHFGGEVTNPPGSLLVSGNTIASYYGNATAVLNQTGIDTATVTGNKFYNIANIENGSPSGVSSNTTMSSQPNAPAWSGGYTSAGASPPPPPPVAPPPPPAASPPPPPVASGTIHGTGWVYGTTGNDSIVGDSGHDSLVGSGGNDTFSGGAYVQAFGGSDVINVASTGTFIDEPNANNAAVNSSVSFSLFDGTYQNVHKLTFTGSANVTGMGTWDNDTFVANAGNDSIVGNGGNDTFVIGTGNDTMVGGSGTDKAVFSDTFASHHFTGTAAALTVTGAHTDVLQNIDTLQFSDVTVSTAQALAGTAGTSPPPPPPPASPPPPPPPPAAGTIHGTGWVQGTSGNDSIVGDSGHDSLVGNGGNDTFSGGHYVQGFGGSDVVTVNDSTTFIDEPDANNATVKSSVSFSLFDGSYNNVHNLTFTGSAPVSGVGTWGHDVLRANGGGDTLTGNGGGDTLVGGAGHDTFVFNSLSDKNSVVQGFVHGQDVLDVHAVLASVGSTGDALANHTLTLVQSGADTQVVINDHGAKSTLVTLQGVSASVLNATDFHY